MRRIWVNGQEYESPEEMPPDVRRDYERALARAEDVNGDGVPDIVEMAPRIEDGEAAKPNGESHSSTNPGSVETREVRSFTEITVNGKTYSSWDQVPEKERVRLRQLMEDVPRAEEILIGLGTSAGEGGRTRESAPTVSEEIVTGREVLAPQTPPRSRGPREIRVELSAGWGWLVALALALAVIWLLLFKG